MALTAAHGLTHHPSFLPLYAVFRDAAAGTGTGAAATAPDTHRHVSDVSGGLTARSDRVVMVYPGGTAQVRRVS